MLCVFFVTIDILLIVYNKKWDKEIMIQWITFKSCCIQDQFKESNGVLMCKVLAKVDIWM